MTPRELIDATLQDSGWGTLEELEANRWLDCQPDFETAHYLKGFAYPDGKFRFKPDWPEVPFRRWHRNYRASHAGIAGPLGRHRGSRHRAPVPARDLAGARLPQFDLYRNADLARATSGGRTVMIHPDDAAALGIADGDQVALGNGAAKSACMPSCSTACAAAC